MFDEVPCGHDADSSSILVYGKNPVKVPAAINVDNWLLGFPERVRHVVVEDSSDVAIANGKRFGVVDVRKLKKPKRYVAALFRIGDNPLVHSPGVCAEALNHDSNCLHGEHYIIKRYALRN